MSAAPPPATASAVALPALDWRRVPLSGRVLIEASAGTGKTWTIAQLYLRLLLEARADVAQVLVCTFTEAAAQELRERLRSRLREAERALAALVSAEDSSQAPQPGDPALRDWLQALLDAGHDGIQLAARLRRARLDFDRAPVSTIHAFFGRALREHPLAGGFGDGELVDEAALLSEAFDDFRRRCLQAPAAERPPYAELLASGGDEALKALQRLFRHPGAARRVPPASAVAGIDAALAPLRDPATPAALRRIADDARYAWIPRRTFTTGLTRLADALETTVPEQLDTSLCKGMTRVQLGKAQRKGAERDASEDPLLAGIADAMDALLQRRRVLQARLLEDAHEACRVAMARLARARGQRTFASLIGDLYDALQSTDGAALAAALRAAWPHALVDEFQDTDARQFAVFDAIWPAGGTGDDGIDTSLHLIGDPKQAIYGFRGGDVAAYLAAADSVAGAAWSIDGNRRSARPLVAGLNALYGAAPDPFLHPRIGYLRVSAHGPAGGRHYTVDGQPLATPLLLHVATDDATRQADHESAALEACAEQIVSLLSDPARCIGDRQLVPEDIAVLLPKNTQVAFLRERLSARGVPVAAAGRSSVYAAPVAGELLLVLHAVLHAGDPAALRGALSSQLLGLDATALRALEHDAAGWDGWAQAFEDWRQLWHQRGVLALVESLQQRVAARTLAEVDGERRLTDLRHLGELLAEEAQHCQGATEQLAWLERTRRRALEEGFASSEERLLRVESEGQRVRLMTLHASKGLQFPLVLLPLAWCGQAGNARGPVACHHPDGGALQFDLGSDDFEAAREAECAEDDQEAARRLYVALTRAIHACHVYWSPAAGARNALQALLAQALGDRPVDVDALQAFCDSHGGIGVERGWRGGFTRLVLRTTGDAPRHARSDLPAPRLPHALHSFSSLHRRAVAFALAEGSAADEAAELVDDALAALDAVPESSTEGGPQGAPGLTGQADPRLLALSTLRGPRFGNAVHRAFELAEGIVDEPALQALVLVALREQGVVLPPGGDALPGRVAALIARCRALALWPDGPVLQSIPSSRRSAELEFHFAVDGASLAALRQACGDHGEPELVPAALGSTRLHGLMTGSIDLVFEHDGAFHLLDYKSNWLGERLVDYQPYALERAMHAAGYPLQALLYTVALHRYLRQRVADYDYERHMGAALYLFVRAVGLAPAAGIWRGRFPATLVDAVDQVLAGRSAGALPA